MAKTANSTSVRKIDRRTAMIGMAATVALAADNVRAEKVDELEDLIRRYDEAWEIDVALWNAVPDDYSPEIAVECEGIVYGWRGGKEKFHHVTANTAEEIERKHREWWRASIEAEPHKRAELQARADQRLAEKLADLDAQRAAKKAHQDASGYTAAMERADAQVEVVRAIEAEIIDYVPQSLGQAARKAAWLMDVTENERCYGHGDDLLMRLAKSLVAAIETN